MSDDPDEQQHSHSPSRLHLVSDPFIEVASSSTEEVGTFKKNLLESSTTTPGLTTAGDHSRHAMSAVLYAMFFNGLITLSKLGVAIWVTPSTALFAEGLHSAADTFNSVTLMVGIMQGKRAPDRNRPYGYGLETNLWALLASFVLFISALVSIWKGWERFHQPPEPLDNVLWGVGLLFTSVIFEVFALSAASRAVLQEVGVDYQRVDIIPQALKHIKSIQSPTTRFVFYEDAVALIGAIIALVAIGIGEAGVHLGFLPKEMAHWPDAIASMTIGVLLLILALNLFSYNRGFLTGAAASVGTEKRLSQLILETHGIYTILDLKTIDQGINGLFVQLKVEVDPDIPIRDVDDIIDHLKTRIQKRIHNVRDVIVEVVADESEENWREVFHTLIAEAEAKELIRPSEGTIFKNVFDFAESKLEDVMIPRTNVIMAEVNDTIEAVADLFIDSRHSKLPVYEENVDKLVGLIHERDVLKCLREGKTDFPLRKLLREIPIYPENKALSDILEEFKHNGNQMAAIVDEHGGFAGMVTISDVVEELVGELWEDEEELAFEDIRELSPTLWEIEGHTNLEDLNEALGLTLPTDEFHTIAGFVFGLLGREPQINDAVQFEDYLFTVQELEGLRIKSLRLNSPFPLDYKTE
jgi:magnesium and cobalt transporter